MLLPTQVSMVDFPYCCGYKLINCVVFPPGEYTWKDLQKDLHALINTPERWASWGQQGRAALILRDEQFEKLGGESTLPKYSDVVFREDQQVLVNLWICKETLNSEARI